MLVSSVSLFDNRFKSYKNANKDANSFSAKTPELPESAKKVVGDVIEITEEKLEKIFGEGNGKVENAVDTLINSTDDVSPFAR